MNRFSYSVLAAFSGLAFLSAPGAAQTSYSAFVPSDTPASGACSFVPMGSSRSVGDPKLRTQRLQIVVTAAELGNKARRITNLAFAPCSSGVRSWTRVTITMDHKKAGALSTTFDDNYQNLVSRPARKVLDRSNYEWINTAGRWNNIGLTRSFDYDPAFGDLLIDIIARNTDFTGADPSMRSDTRQGVHASNFSPTPRTGALTMESTKLRLSDSAGYIDLIAPGCGPGPLALQANGKPNPAGHLDMQITGGRASTVPTIAVLLFGFQKIQVGFGQDCAIRTNPDILFFAPLTGGKSSVFRFPIPNDNAVVGGKVYFQGAEQDPWQTRVGYVFTENAEVTIGY